MNFEFRVLREFILKGIKKNSYFSSFLSDLDLTILCTVLNPDKLQRERKGECPRGILFPPPPHDKYNCQRNVFIKRTILHSSISCVHTNWHCHGYKRDHYVQ